MKVCVDGPVHVGRRFVAAHYTERFEAVSRATNVSFHFLDKPGASEHAFKLLRSMAPHVLVYVHTTCEQPTWVKADDVFMYATSDEANAMWLIDCDQFVQVWPALYRIDETLEYGYDPVCRLLNHEVVDAVVQSIQSYQARLSDSALKRIAAIIEEDCNGSDADDESSACEEYVDDDDDEDYEVDEQEDDGSGEVLGEKVQSPQRRRLKRRRHGQTGDALMSEEQSYLLRNSKSTSAPPRRISTRSTTATSLVASQHIQPSVPIAMFASFAGASEESVDEVLFESFCDMMHTSRTFWPQTHFYNTHSIDTLYQLAGTIGRATRKAVVDEVMVLILAGRLSTRNVLLNRAAQCWLCDRSNCVLVSKVMVASIDDEFIRRQCPTIVATTNSKINMLLGNVCRKRIEALINTAHVLNATREYVKTRAEPNDDAELKPYYVEFDRAMTSTRKAFATAERFNSDN